MKKRLWVLLWACCLMLGITGCNGAEGLFAKEGDSVILQQRINEDLIYYASDLDLGLSSDAENVDFKVYGSGIYYPEGQTIATYAIADRTKTADVYKWANAPGTWDFEHVCYSRTGEVYGVLNVGAGTNNAHYLCKFDTERNLVFARDLGEYMQETGESNSIQRNKLEAGADGRVYLSNTDKVLIFEADGSYKGTVSFGSVKDVQVLDLQSDAKAKLYVLYEDNSNQKQYVAELDTEKAAVTAVQQTIGLTGVSTTADGLLGYSGAMAYLYDREACTLTEIVGWSECNVSGSAVYSVHLLADGNLFVAGNIAQGGIQNYLVKNMLMEQVADSENGKTDIRIAVYSSRTSDVFTQAVTRFNRNHELYNVVMVDYSLDGKDAARARLSGELAAGIGPDIVDLSIGDVESLAEAGYLEDLMRYLEKSDVVSEGDFLEIALEEYRINDMLVAIPHHFSMSFLIGNSDFVGEKRGWTMNEMLDFLEQNVGQQVFATEVTRYDFFYYMLQMNEGYFIDKGEKTCDFDHEIFRRMVELAAEYPLEREVVPEGEIRPSEFANLQNGNGILHSVSTIEIQWLQPYEAALDGKINYIGYPDEGGAGIAAYTICPFGIVSTSQCKEGAWEFIEYFMQYVAGGSSINFFPTYRPALQTVLETAMESGSESEMGYGRDRWQFRNHRPTQEEVDFFYTLLEAARPANVDRELIQIILEEIEGYYAGEATMDEVIGCIEREVQLYLENS